MIQTLIQFELIFFCLKFCSGLEFIFSRLEVPFKFSLFSLLKGRQTPLSNSKGARVAKT